jgi:cell division protein FtsW
MIRAGETVLLCVLTLLCIGVVMVASAGMNVGDAEQVTFQSIVFSRSAIYLLLAVIAMLVVSALPLRRIADSAMQGTWVLWLIPVILFTLALVYVPGVSHEAKGSSRWIKIPIPGIGLTMQPSELAKWGMIVLVSWYAVRRSDALHRFRTGLLPALLLTGMLTAVVIKEDLGTGFLILCMATVVLIGAGARLWHFIAMTPIAAAGLALAVWLEPYRVRRLTTFIDPYADPEGAGYHVIQSTVAIANGHGTGRGLGFGLQKFGYLPEDRTDFLFAIICEEAGIVGATIVVSLYILLLVAGFRIVTRQTQPLLKLIGLGILATVGIQTVINLLVVTGLAPTKGIALPLLSSGGTGWILTAASLGVLVAMDRQTRNAAASQPGATVPSAVPLKSFPPREGLQCSPQRSPTPLPALTLRRESDPLHLELTPEPHAA